MRSEVDALVASTAEAAFAVDQTGQIVAWNDGARDLLGHACGRAVGTQCGTLLRGVDVFGNRFCGAHCPLRRMVTRREELHGVELGVRDGTNGLVRVLLLSFVLPRRAPEDFYLIHVLRPVERRERRKRRKGAAERLGTARGRGSKPATHVRLTPRQKEVLQLLCQGTGTEEIAKLLGVSVKTVRNHIQQSLRKMGCHSRLEAVSMARRRNLI